MCQHKCCRNYNHPGKNRIKQKSDQRFSSGAQRKIRSMTKGTKWHNNCRNCNKTGCKLFDLFRSIINLWEKSTDHKHHARHKRTAEYTENNHFIICVFRFFQFTSPKILTNHNADTCSKLDIDNVKQIRDRSCNIKTCHNFQSSNGITLGNGCHTCCP